MSEPMLNRVLRPFCASFLTMTLFLVLALPSAAQAPQTAPATSAKGEFKVNFVDIAEKAGLTAQNVYGGVDTKKYIIETTGSGVGVIDYDNDGWPDLFFANGTTLEG